jgi:hypothetical protein
MKTVKTPKGTVLPLTNLKGKDYLMVAYRIQWFTEEVPMFHISTHFPVLDDTQTIAQVTVVVLNEQGQAVRKAMGTKRETKTDFSDHTEKAETGALGRALIQLGYGTQYALADLDEGNRIVDSPLPDPRQTVPAGVAKLDQAVSNLPAGTTATSATATPTTGAKVSSFRKKKAEKAAEAAPAASAAPMPSNGAKNDDWL